jgi:hypothetical protein
MAPPTPSEAIAISSWTPTTVHKGTPFAGHAGSTAPDANTCCAKTSGPWMSLRSSCHATIAPPRPSATITGSSCPPSAVASDAASVSSARPSTGQAVSTSPEARTCCTKTVGSAPRPSCHVMSAPPAPSVATCARF